MSLILNIDCSLEKAFISIAHHGIPVTSRFCETQKQHAGFVHVTIEELLKDAKLELSDFAAIAVTEGPGSYTGLRVGMSSAIGLCYALQKPFIRISTLRMIAQDVIHSIVHDNVLICPMVDARRMEVFTAIYDHDLNERVSPCALVLTQDSFNEILTNQTIYFCGNGSSKFKAIIDHKNAIFCAEKDLVASMAYLSYKAFLSADFGDFVSSEPNYIKDYVNFNLK